MAISASTPHAIDSRHGYAMLLIVAGSVAISFGGLVLRSIENADSWQINFYRSLGMLIAAIFIIIGNYRGRILPILTGIGPLGILAALLLSAAGVCFVQALTHTTVANALFTLGSIPFFAALFARLILGERLRRTTLWTMIVAATGLSVMVFSGISHGSAYGNLMALITALSFAAYAIIVRYKRQVEMVPVMLLSSVGIIAVSYLVTQGDIDIPFNDILLCLFWGACLSGFVNWTFIVASRHLAAAEVTLVMLLEFALGPVWVWWFIGETPSATTLFGGVLIIAAVASRSIFEIWNKPKPEQTPGTPV